MDIIPRLITMGFSGRFRRRYPPCTAYEGLRLVPEGTIGIIDSFYSPSLRSVKNQQRSGDIVSTLTVIMCQIFLPLANLTTLRGLLDEVFDHELVLRNDG